MILGFGNKSRAGKDTCCAAIIDFYNNRKRLAAIHGRRYQTFVKKISFADALRREVTEATIRAGSTEELLKQGIDGLPFPDWVTLDPNPDTMDPLLPYGKHPKILQWWGTEYRRKQDPEYWIKEWQKQIAGFKGVIVTGDVRFLNEAKAIKQAGGYTINVTRLNKDGSPYRDPYRPADHISETELDNFNWDFRIIGSDGHAALTGEQAITISEYLGGLNEHN
jgi:hypothetical protein